MKHVDVLADVERVERTAIADVAFGGVDLDVGRGLVRTPRVLAGSQLPSLFEHAHRLPGPGQSRRGDRSSVAGPHHDHLVVIGEIGQRR